jgi:transcriptional regulator with XRE-family HTH domain
MSVRDGSISRARRRIAEDRQRTLREIDTARRSAGLSDRELGRACGASASTVCRVLGGKTAHTDLEFLACLGAAVGQELRLRTFPAGDPIRDAGQARLLERLRSELHPSLGWRTEVPLPIDGDMRAWDAVVSGRAWRLAVEAETVLTDIQAVERRLALKRRDGKLDHVLLLVADTRRNRAAVLASPAAFADLAAPARVVLAALREGRDPGGSGVVFL